MSTITFLFLTVFIVRYIPQLIIDIKNKQNEILFRAKTDLRSELIMAIYVIIFIVSLIAISLNQTGFNFINQAGIALILLGTIIGLSALWIIRYEYNEELVIYTNGKLRTSGVYSIIRHPLRVSLSIELLGYILLSNLLIITPLLLIVISIQIIRTSSEDKMLLKFYGDEAYLYQQRVPSFNFILGLLKLVSYRRSKRLLKV